MEAGVREQVEERPVVADGRPGVLFALARWGQSVRWYWVRHEDGSEKAYPPARVRRADREPAR